MAYSYTMMALEVWNKQDLGQVNKLNTQTLQKCEEEKKEKIEQALSLSIFSNHNITYLQVHSEAMVKRKRQMLQAKQKVIKFIYIWVKQL